MPKTSANASQHHPPAPLGEELNQYLFNLSKHHQTVLGLMDEKQKRLRRLDGPGLKQLETQEQQAVVELERYVRHRQALLARAAETGIRAGSLGELVRHLPSGDQQRATPLLERAATLGKTIQRRCLTNWVLGQRAVLHTSQLLRLIGGGETEATYGRSESEAPGGTLIDQAV